MDGVDGVASTGSDDDDALGLAGIPAAGGEFSSVLPGELGAAACISWPGAALLGDFPALSQPIIRSGRAMMTARAFLVCMMVLPFRVGDGSVVDAHGVLSS
jgi:hypothetical protein